MIITISVKSIAITATMKSVTEVNRYVVRVGYGY